LLSLQDDIDRHLEDGGKRPEDKVVASAQRAATMAVLAVLPAFDELTKEAGLD